MITRKAKNLAIAISLLSTMTLFACGAAGSGTVKISSSGAKTSLTAIELTPSNPSIAVGTTQQFAVTGIYSDNSTQDVTAFAQWTSSNASKVSVNGSGLATGTGIGSTTVTAEVGNCSHTATITVTGAVLQSLAINPTNPSIANGTTQQFTAMGTFSDNSTQDLTTSVTWRSSNTGVASISNGGSRGLAASTAAGTTTITATSGSISKTTTLTVTPASLISISITPTNPSIALGTIQQFSATGTYSDNTTQDLTATVTWSSSSTGTATISNAIGSKGLATSVTAGSSTITATSGNISGTTILTVTPATLVSITIAPTDTSIALGATQQYSAIGTYSNNTTQNLTSTVTWSSSNTGVATISNAGGFNGLATPVTSGSTTIMAISGSISRTTTLTVSPASLISIAITPTNSSIASGTTRQFSATGTYSDNTTQNLTATVTWSSSNTGVATISNAAGSKGLATSVTAGTTTIAATSGAVSKSTTLTVNPAPLVSIAIAPTNPSIASGTTQQFTATGTYSDNSSQNITASVTWSSSDTSVGSISNAAGSKGLATGINAGSATITASSGSISNVATLTVTGSNTVNLTWDAPTQFMDGSPLYPATDIKSYKLYYGTVDQSYTNVISFSNPGTSTVTKFVTLPAGTYCFVVTSVSQSNDESLYSNQVWKTF